MSKAVLAILAHADRRGLEGFLANVSAFAGDSEIVMYNGGTDAELHRGLGIELCPSSRPLTYGRLARFHFDVMRWVHETRPGYEFIITLEPDMALLRPGLEDTVGHVLATQRSSYLGTNFWKRTSKDLPFGMTEHAWERDWQPLLGTDRPYGCLNPGQVFGRTFVERLLAHPKLDDLLVQLDRTTIHAMEEVAWPSLAVAMDCSPYWVPYSDGITLQRHSPSALRSFLETPWIHLVHKVSPDPEAPDRMIVRQLMRGETPDFDSISDGYLRKPFLRRHASKAQLALWEAGKRAKGRLISR